jgi:hypothetical protein
VVKTISVKNPSQGLMEAFREVALENAEHDAALQGATAVVTKWLDDNELDYAVAEAHDDLIMLRPCTAGDLPIALLRTEAGWQPFVWHDPDEEGWTDLHDLDEVL